MLDNLVTYHIHRQNPLPANNALGYQYILAGSGLFIRAETRFFQARFAIAPCLVRGLATLETHFRLKAPRIPEALLTRILADARRARRPVGGGTDNGLNEVFYRFHHQGRTVQVKKPAQHATAASVLAPGSSETDILCDLHTHGNMPAFWSKTDDADEQGCQLYAVAGKLETAPEMRLRLGVYGYWLPLPVTAVFTGSGPFQDLYQKENES
jgi:PRTRC genetic system protein A